MFSCRKDPLLCVFIGGSEFKANGDPVVAKVVAPSENFQVLAIRYKRLDHLVNFFGLLTLASSLGKDDVAANIVTGAGRRRALQTNQTTLLCVLQVVSMSFRQAPIHSTLHPRNIVNLLVSPLLHQFQCEGITRVDHPDEQKPILLQFLYRNFFNCLIRKLSISKRDLPITIEHHNQDVSQSCHTGSPSQSNGNSSEESGNKMEGKRGIRTPRVGAAVASCQGGSIVITSNCISSPSLCSAC